MTEQQPTTKLHTNYPPMPEPKHSSVVDGLPCITVYEHQNLMRAYVDADRTMRAQAAHAAAAGTSQLQAEAAKLAPILRNMIEGGATDGETDIYADDYDPPDGDVFIVRAAELLAALATPTTQAAPQPADDDEGMTHLQWINQAMRVYLIAGDTEDEAQECAKALCSEQNWDPLQDDLGDPYDQAMSDIEGRGPAPQPAAPQGDAIATAVCQSVAELPDRNSPEDWPEAMLVTADELHMIVREAIAAQQAAPVAEGDALDTARSLFDAGWKACAKFFDRDDAIYDGIVGSTGCPQFETAFEAVWAAQQDKS